MQSNACYTCGKPGHKRDRCPQKRVQTQCYECGEYGHYKNECPALIEQERLQKAAALQKSDAEWFQTHLPDNASDFNTEEIRNFIENGRKYIKINADVNISGHDEVISLHYSDGKIICHLETPLGRSLHDKTLNEFINFARTKSCFIKLTQTFVRNNLESMIYDLKKVGVVSCEEVEHDRENHYIYKSQSERKVLMRSRRHSTDWNSKVCKQYAGLICELNDAQNNISSSLSDITPVTNSVNFVYHD